MGYGWGVSVRETWVGIQIPTFTSCVCMTLGEPLNFAEPQFSHLENGHRCTSVD